MRPILLRDFSSDADRDELESVEPEEPQDDLEMEDLEVLELPVPESVPPLEEQEPAELMSLEDALHRIPVPLRREMEELLRAKFREVRPWQPGTHH